MDMYVRMERTTVASTSSEWRQIFSVERESSVEVDENRETQILHIILVSIIRVFSPLLYDQDKQSEHILKAVETRAVGVPLCHKLKLFPVRGYCNFLTYSVTS